MTGMPGIRLLRRARTAVLSVAFLLVLGLPVLAGCTWGSPASPPPSGPQLTAALGHWSSFPVSATTRPLVIASSAQITGPGQFPTEADATAFSAGAINLPRSLPSGPHSMGGFMLISAARAATVLTSAHTSRPTFGPAASPAPSTRVTVTSVRLGTGIFLTDRGRQALPAWQFSFQGISGRAAVLAVAASQRFWPAGLKQVTTHLSAAQPGRSGRRLTLTAEGAQAGTGPCQASYSVRQQSSAHAVAMDVVAKLHDSGQACSAVGVGVTLPVALPAPLGNRVLVDASTFAPIPVTQPLVSSS